MTVQSLYLCVWKSSGWITHLVFLSQFALTTVLVVLMETTNPATRAMDSFHAVLVFYLTEPVHLVMMTKWFYGTILRRDVGIVLIRATQTIYWYETRDLNNSGLFLFCIIICICFLFHLTSLRCTALWEQGGGVSNYGTDEAAWTVKTQMQITLARKIHKMK